MSESKSKAKVPGGRGNKEGLPAINKGGVSKRGGKAGGRSGGGGGGASGAGGKPQEGELMLGFIHAALHGLFLCVLKQPCMGLLFVF